MSKKLLITALLLILSADAYAARLITAKSVRKATTLTPISNLAIASGDTVTTEAIKTNGNVGYNSFVVNVSGDVDIDQQVSIDGSTWYTPYTSDGETLATSGSIVNNLTANRWFSSTAHLAPYVRFIFTANSTSTVSFKYLFQEDI